MSTRFELADRPVEAAALAEPHRRGRRQQVLPGPQACRLGSRRAGARECGRLHCDRTGGGWARPRALFPPRGVPRRSPPVPARARRRPPTQVRRLVPGGTERLVVSGRCGSGADRPRDDDAARGVCRFVVAELRKRADRILGDEKFHQRFVEGRLRELSLSPAEALIVEDELAALLPETLCWFGPTERGGPRGAGRRRDRRARQRCPCESVCWKGSVHRPREQACACKRREELPWEPLEQPGAPADERAGAGDVVRARGAAPSRSSDSPSSGLAS